MKERTPKQILQDCLRCERAKTRTCTCKKCDGKSHGFIFRQEVNEIHDIKGMMTNEEFLSLKGI